MFPCQCHLTLVVSQPHRRWWFSMTLHTTNVEGAYISVRHIKFVENLENKFVDGQWELVNEPENWNSWLQAAFHGLSRKSCTEAPEHQSSTWFASSEKMNWVTHCNLWPASQCQSAKWMVPIQRLHGATISVSRHFVAANGKALPICSSKWKWWSKNTLCCVLMFFPTCKQFWNVFFGAVPLSTNSPNESCSKTRYRSSSVDVAVSSATLRPCACSTRSRKQAMWNHNMSGASVELSLLSPWRAACGRLFQCFYKINFIRDQRPPFYKGIFKGD